jgi:hypothetical protein
LNYYSEDYFLKNISGVRSENFAQNFYKLYEFEIMFFSKRTQEKIQKFWSLLVFKFGESFQEKFF